MTEWAMFGKLKETGKWKFLGFTEHEEEASEIEEGTLLSPDTRYSHFAVIDPDGHANTGESFGLAQDEDGNWY